MVLGEFLFTLVDGLGDDGMSLLAEFFDPSSQSEAPELIECLDRCQTIALLEIPQNCSALGSLS